jgi:hypothetical protein
MLHGQYEYHAEMDDMISLQMEDTAYNLLNGGYDVIIDCANLTRQRRQPWLNAANHAKAKTVAVVLPRMYKDWHIGRRQADPHWQTDWGKVFDDEKAAIEPVESSGEKYDDVIFVPVEEVSGRRILILSASPVRDKHIDNLIAARLRGLGHDVEVAPCLRGGREKVLDFRPDIVLVPPIRNPNSRDFVAELKRFGCAVVTRHTEPSCSWQDFKKMTPQARQEILGAFPYTVDLELVWSQDEAEILNRRAPVSSGACRRDRPGHLLPRRAAALRGHATQGVRVEQTRVLAAIQAASGDADSAHLLALGIRRLLTRLRDRGDAGCPEGRGWPRSAPGYDPGNPSALKDSWNLLMTVHPGVGAEPCKALAQELGILIDTESPMLDLLPHCDVLIHAGSTAAVSAHLLAIPGFQYGDVNAEGSANWWGVGESAISRVSPMAKTAEELTAMIRTAQGGSNANPATIKELQEGRYGRIDGRATERAVEHIVKLAGRFQWRWPRSPHDYRQPTVQRTETEFLKKAFCGVCRETFVFWTDEYLAQVAKVAGIDPQKLRPKGSICCPHCAAKMFQV